MNRTEAGCLVCGLAGALLAVDPVAGVARQPSAQAAAATVRLHVVHLSAGVDTLPVERAAVRAGSVARFTDTAGTATLRLRAGTHLITIGRIGFAPESLTVTLVSGVDTTVQVRLEEQSTQLEAVIVTATRSGRRIEDEPVRVEVLDEDEMNEKLDMTPGDITMMLNETPGLRVQTTSPSLGGANVRVQGYVHIGIMVERRFGPARLFVNAENLLDVRQTSYDPLVRPSVGLGGRWTTDVWAPLDGRVANLGIRLDLAGAL